MADFEAPSFSLGLDCDLPDSEPQTSAVCLGKDPSSSNQFSVAAATLEDENDDFETLMVDDSESEYSDTHPKLKRLRRGPAMDATSLPSSASAKAKAELHSRAVVDGADIDMFSWQDDRRTDEHLYTQHHAVCTSSKFPQNKQGVLTNQPGNRKQHISNACELVSISCNNLVFPKLTVSPLRRSQLIDYDSDFDDPSVSQGANNRKCNGSESYSNQGQSHLPQHVGLSKQRKVNELVNLFTAEDPWEDSRPEKSFHTTPASDFDASLPPAHRYFFHDDLRIQELVRSRLPNFSPLGDMSNRDLEQPSTSTIDYMGQFSYSEGSKQAARNIKDKKSSTSSKISKSKTEETSQGWVNPKLGADKGIAKDAVKRRVHAVSQTAGHWLTGLDGKKIYVGKSGQELTGRVAYRQYKKESGAGFKKAKGKSANNKKKKK